MSQISTKALADDSVNDLKIKLRSNQPLRARNNAGSADVNLLKLNSSDILEFSLLPQYSGSSVATQGYVTTALGSYVLSSLIGANSGVCPLDGTGKVASTYLPAYVDDVLEYANLAAFPVSGTTGIIYVALDTNKTFRWSGSAYIEISPSEVNSVNGSTGVVVLTTSNISEGSNLYYTAARFNAAFSGKSTTDLTEGTNLYFTDSRAKTAAVLNSTSGSQTDQAASVSAMKSYVAANSATVSTQFFTLSGTNITNQYIDLSVTATGILSVDVKGYPTFWLTDDYSVSLSGGASGTTRISFAGDMASLLSGDKVKVTYK
jgi:hypothetical protein